MDANELDKESRGEPAEVVDRSHWPTRLTRLHDPEDESYILSLTPEQRVEMVWQLTLDAWGFKEGLLDEPRLRRDIGRVVRRGS